MQDIIYTTEDDLTYNVASRVKGYDVLWDAQYDSKALIDARDKFILELCTSTIREV